MAAGFVCWIGGTILGQQEIAVIGGVLVVGVGAAIMLFSLEYRDGKIESTNADNETVHDPQYSEVKTQEQLPLGTVVMLLGGTISLRALDNLGR